MFVICSTHTGEILDSRPPWYGSSHTTQDLSQANKALLYGLNPNDPAMSGQSLKHHNKFGQLNTRSRSRTSPNADFGLNSKTRRGTHRSVSVSCSYLLDSVEIHVISFLARC